MYSNLFFIERFQWVNHELNELLEGVDENVFLRVPNHGGWCVGEIISHINKTTDLYLSQMEPPFEKKERYYRKGIASIIYHGHYVHLLRLLVPSLI